jgi:hypothetical protein
MLIDKLTHRNDIYIGVIHSFIILLCHIQANVCPRLEFIMLIPETFPLRHELVGIRLGHLGRFRSSLGGELASQDRPPFRY